MKLTDKALRGAAPRGKPYKVYDGYGLYVEVRPSGRKVWCYKYRFVNKEKKLTMGDYPAISLAEARDLAIDARRSVAAGNDPARAKQEYMRSEQRAEMNKFSAVLAEWQRLRKDRVTDRTHLKQSLRIERDVLPTLGNMRVTDITPLDVLELVRRLERKHGQGIAALNLSYITQVLRLAVQTGLIEHNPASELTGVVSRQEKSHRPALPVEDIPRFLSGLDASSCHPFTQWGLRLLLLTFVRPFELCGAEWEEFDEKKRLWRIPASRMKGSSDHLVPLSEQALTMLVSLRALSGKSRYLFPSSSAAKHITTNALSTAMIRLGWRDKAVPHGFRALASSVLNEHGFSPDAIERQLAHVERNKVRAAYNRAQYLPERTRIMQWWADFVDGSEVSGAVVPVDFRRVSNA